MNFLQQELEKRSLPELMQLENAKCKWEQRKSEIKEILSREFAGYPVRFPVRSQGEVVKKDGDALGGKAVVEKILLKVESDFNAAYLPFHLAVPKDVKKPPLFIMLSFSPVLENVGTMCDGICEEIIDHGYAVANIYYQDIVPDYYDEHKNGLGMFCSRNPYDSWGKLKIWSWAAQRVLDYVLEEKVVDEKRVAVVGHSRLGKAALLAGAFDERFALTISNESGAGGAALFRGKGGEGISDLYGKGSRLWFAGNFFHYLEHTEQLPFDQHFLLSLFAGRHLYVSSATKDTWSDPQSEFLSCVAATPAFALMGQKGLVTPDEYPKAGVVLHVGDIGYHLRDGTHYMGRYDWNRIFEYRELHHI